MSNLTRNREYLRRAKRAREPGGHALCHDAMGHQSHYMVRDASRSGIALANGPRLPLGTALQLELNYPDIGSAIIEGFVCRHCDDDARMAVRTTGDRGLGELLSNLFVLESLRERDPHVLVCGNGALSAKAIRDLQSAGFPVLQAHSALEAIRILQDPWSLTTAATFETGPRWLELSSFIGEEFPQLRRTLLIPGIVEADDYDLLERGHADHALHGPWLRQALIDSLELQVSEELCLSCSSPLASTVSPFCVSCLDWSRNIDGIDDIGVGD